MELRDLKRRGAIFVEVLVSILLFTVGILALAATLLYGVKVIAESREETKNEQNYKNTVENETLRLIRKPNLKPSGTSIGPISINGIPLPLTLLKYKYLDKEGTEIYLLRGE